MSEPSQPQRKFKLDRKICDGCRKPTDYQLEGVGIVRIKCWECGKLLEMRGVTLSEDAIWKEREDHLAKQEAGPQSN